MRAIVVAMMLATTPAMACNEQLFEVTDWTASAAPDGNSVQTEVEIEMQFVGDRGYRMIQAGIIFEDALNNALVTVPLDRDRSRQPSEAFTQRGLFTARSSRISEINPDDVTYRTCVWSIVYDDGEVQRFD